MKLDEVIAARKAADDRLAAARSDLARATAAMTAAEPIRQEIETLKAKRDQAIGEAFLASVKPDTATLDAAIAAAERKLEQISGTNSAATHAAQVARNRIAEAETQLEALAPEVHAAGVAHIQEQMAVAERDYEKASRVLQEVLGRFAALRCLLEHGFGSAAPGAVEFQASSLSSAIGAYMATSLVAGRIEKGIGAGLVASSPSLVPDVEQPARANLRKMVGDLASAGLPLDAANWPLDAALHRSPTAITIPLQQRRQAAVERLNGLFEKHMATYSGLVATLRGKIAALPEQPRSARSWVENLPQDAPESAVDGRVVSRIDPEIFAGLEDALRQARAVARAQEIVFEDGANLARIVAELNMLSTLCMEGVRTKNLRVPNWAAGGHLSDDLLEQPLVAELRAQGHREREPATLGIFENGRRISYSAAASQ